MAPHVIKLDSEHWVADTTEHFLHMLLLLLLLMCLAAAANISITEYYNKQEGILRGFAIKIHINEHLCCLCLCACSFAGLVITVVVVIATA